MIEVRNGIPVEERDFLPAGRRFFGHVFLTTMLLEHIPIETYLATDGNVRDPEGGRPLLVTRYERVDNDPEHWAYGMMMAWPDMQHWVVFGISESPEPEG